MVSIKIEVDNEWKEYNIFPECSFVTNDDGIAKTTTVCDRIENIDIEGEQSHSTH